MEKERKYYLIEESILPEAILKVLEAKALIRQNKVKYVSEAVKQVGISRSVFYKYHESVHPFHENKKHATFTLGLELTDDKGVLSNMLSILSSYDLNVLTIHQTIPIHHIANVTITFETLNDQVNVEKMISEMRETDKINKVSILARE